ncbi:MAG: hypothetical protein LUC50_00235 [Ruminococcus sp.]|nr:hypothetical protein [Ruminococcus sp.]
MKCEKCGCDVPERAVICPECGVILPRETEQQLDAAQSDVPSSFSMPFLVADADETVNEEIDPREKQAELTVCRNVRIRRIVFSAVAVVLVALVVLYTVFLGGYKLAAFRYIKGVDYSSGSMYLALVPDAFMDYLETTYETTRRDIKELVSDYFVSWNSNYGNEGSMSYSITTESDASESTIDALEEELKTDYDIKVDISKAVTVSFRLNDGGEIESEKATFVKIGMKWCCIEAMEQIDYVCAYDGYGQW